jgi:opacity protein-like surface antigen
MKTRMIITAIIMATFTMSSMAQKNNRRLGLEIRPGVSLATTKLGDAELKPGMGFEGTLQYNFWNGASLYAGWGWNKFASDESFAGSNMDFEETGYVMGLRYTYQLPKSPLGLFAKAGAIYCHIEVEDGGDVIADSGHGWGWQAEAGVDIALGKGWTLRPGLKYQSLNRDLTVGNASPNVDLNYLSLGVGIAKCF